MGDKNDMVPVWMYHKNTLSPDGIMAYSNHGSSRYLIGDESRRRSTVKQTDRDLISLPGTKYTKADTDGTVEGRPSAEQLEVVFQYLTKEVRIRSFCSTTVSVKFVI